MVSWQRNFGVVLAALTGFCGCAGSRASAPSARPPGEAAAGTGAAIDGALIADLLRHHRHHHYGGVLMLLTMSLDSLGLPDDRQIPVERLQQDLLDKMRPAGRAERDLMGLLADGIAAARIDTGEVDTAIGRVTAASAAVHDVGIDDLNQLHAILTAPERAALLEKLDAHWTLWKQANAGAQGHLSVLGDEIGLTPEQLEKVRAALPSAPSLPEAEVAAYLRDFEVAFRADAFDARALAKANPANRDLATWAAQWLAHFCEAVNPVLTEAQRTYLVALLREHENDDEAQAVLP
jgi:hypothetical protein